MSRPVRPKVVTSKMAIAEYWASQEALDNGDPLLCIDIGEPSCWACQMMLTDFDGQADAYAKVGHLERCHLIPHAEGGADEPANLVLLCSHCHALMDLELGRERSRATCLAWIQGAALRMIREFQSGLGDTEIPPFTSTTALDVLTRAMDAMSEDNVDVQSRYLLGQYVAKELKVNG